MSKTDSVTGWLPCPVVFISTAHGDKRDIMTATAQFISETEPVLAVSVAQDHLTAQLIEQSGEFTLVIAAEGQQELVWQVGSARGDAEDKFERFSIETLPPQEGTALVPVDAAAWMQCRVVERHEIAQNYLMIARVVNQQELGNPPLVWRNQSLYRLEVM